MGQQFLQPRQAECDSKLDASHLPAWLPLIALDWRPWLREYDMEFSARF